MVEFIPFVGELYWTTWRDKIGRISRFTCLSNGFVDPRKIRFRTKKEAEDYQVEKFGKHYIHSKKGKVMKSEGERKLLSRLAHLMDVCGYDNTDLFGKALSYFDFNKIRREIEKYEEIEASMNSQTIEEYKSLRND